MTDESIVIVTPCDLSKPAGDTMRTIGMANLYANTGIPTFLLAPRSPSDPAVPIDARVSMHAYGSPYGEKKSKTRSIRTILSAGDALSKAPEGKILVEGSPLAYYISLLTGRPYTLDLHGLIHAESAYWSRFFTLAHVPSIISKAELDGCRRADRIIAVSNPMKDYLSRNWGIDEDKIVVVPNGYFEENVSRARGAKIDQQLITFVGQLSPWAKVERIIDLAGEIQDFRIAIVGGGSEEEMLRDRARRKKITNVHFYGPVDPVRCLQIVASSRAVLCPLPRSLALEVAWPIKLIEYAALGRPIICDPVGQLPRLLISSGAALGTRTDDPDTFARTALNLLSDEKMERKVSKNALSFSRDYSWKSLSVRIPSV